MTADQPRDAAIVARLRRVLNEHGVTAILAALTPTATPELRR